MARTVKTMKDNDGKELEFYSDNCNVCNKEMIFLKSEVDRLETMFPFVKEKAKNGSPCMECVMSKDNKTDPASMFSKEELENIKNIVMSRFKK